MGVLRVDGLSKAFGIENLFSDVNFELHRGDKVGLIGANGTGKTTLLRCLLGFEQADSGQISLPAGETIGYVEQDAGRGGHTFYQELAGAYSDVLNWQFQMRRLEDLIAGEKDENVQAGLLKEYAKVVDNFERAGGYEYESNIRRVAFGLGFNDDDFNRTLDSFSGGQKTRICLARALLRQPDFLFLDEPTNHLDVGMVEWLEDFLAGYPGGVLIISHDRYFLDKVTSRILELENGKLSSYNGNYSDYLRQKEERMAALAGAYEKQQAFIAKTQAFIERYRAGVKSKQARGREKRLARLERIVLPPEVARFDFFAFNPPSECAERVAELDKVSAAYGDKTIFRDISLLVRRGDGVALVGPNGAGKTTLLKLLTGDIAASAGRVKIGSRVKIGYFSQEHEGLNVNNRILDELNQEFGLSEERARHYLAAFLFQGDDVYKVIGDLSGGEKARLALLKLMLTGANFLILDEPTNHLDIPAKEAVEEAIMSFPGTFLVVSHDRYFLDKVANCVIELDNGQLVEYFGNYSYYREKKLVKEKALAAERSAGRTVVPEKKVERPRQRKQDNARRLKKLEAEIAGLEAAITALEEKLADPEVYADPAESKALADEYLNLQNELEVKYEQWLNQTEE